jgi:hypothetical protein
MARIRSFDPAPRDKGENPSVRDAYDRQWQAEKAQREGWRKAAQERRKAGR